MPDAGSRSRAQVVLLRPHAARRCSTGPATRGCTCVNRSRSPLRPTDARASDKTLRNRPSRRTSRTAWPTGASKIGRDRTDPGRTPGSRRFEMKKVRDV